MHEYRYRYSDLRAARYIYVYVYGTEKVSPKILSANVSMDIDVWPQNGRNVLEIVLSTLS